MSDVIQHNYPNGWVSCMSDLIVKNLEYLMNKRGIENANALQSASGILQSTTWRILTGVAKSPRDTTLKPYADFFGVSVASIRSVDLEQAGDDPISRAANPSLLSSHDKQGMLMVPVVEARFCCGSGEPIEYHFEAIEKELPFEDDFFSKRGRKYGNCRLMRAMGDSMENYILDGDLFMIDETVTEPRDGEVYAVYFEGEAMLKRIFKEAGGALILSSDNKKYRDKRVTPENGASFKILGEQFYRSG